MTDVGGRERELLALRLTDFNQITRSTTSNQRSGESPSLTLDKRLNAMPWLRGASWHRRANQTRFTRHGRRYRPVQDHGTARGREGIEEMHQLRAELHAHGLYWPLARQRTAEFKRLRASNA